MEESSKSNNLVAKIRVQNFIGRNKFQPDNLALKLNIKSLDKILFTCNHENTDKEAEKEKNEIHGEHQKL